MYVEFLHAFSLQYTYNTWYYLIFNQNQLLIVHSYRTRILQTHVSHVVIQSAFDLILLKEIAIANRLKKYSNFSRFFKSNEGGQTNANTVANHTNTATTAVSLSNNGKSTTEKCIRNGTTVSPRINGGGKDTDTDKHELQTIVISNTSATNMETTVTTALLTTSDTMSAQSLTENKSEPKLTNNIIHNVTVDIISNEKVAICNKGNATNSSKCDQNNPSLNLDSSANCEECCRSCSCGEPASSLEDSNSEAEYENGGSTGVNADQQPMISKSSTATQTPISS